MPSPERRLPPQDITTSLPPFSEADWDISDEQIDAQIAETSPAITSKERKMTTAETEADRADKTRQAELRMLIQEEDRRKAEEIQKAADDALIENVLSQIDTVSSPTTERPAHQQILQLTDDETPQTRSLFGKMKKIFGGIRNLFSRKDKYTQQVEDMAAMSDEEVAAEVQATAAAEAAARDAQAEAYAAKLEAGPGKARQAVDVVGNAMTATLDAAQNIIQYPIGETKLATDAEIDETSDRMQAAADLKEGKQLTKWSNAIDRRARKNNMTRMEALVDRIREINGEINAEGFGESDPKFDPRVAELQHLELLLEEPNFENTTTRNTRSAAKTAINKARRDIDTAARKAGNIKGF
jgi:hypothetical protein